MKYIVREIVYTIIMIYLKIKNKSLMIGFRSKASIKSQFEGFNKLSHHSFFGGGIMGYGSYIGAYSIVVGKIGKYCCIADNVSFITKTHPVREFVSIHPCFYSLKKQGGFTYIKKQLFDEEPKVKNKDYSIIVGNDVYIGYGATIIGPVIIGDGAIIAAGSVVTHNVPPFTVVGGNPAKEIRKRFSDHQIRIIKRVKWWNMDEGWIRENLKSFESIDLFVRNFSDYREES